ncbi:MAG TPA: tetratricopeptide repeat protein [Myxococcota bacterium]|nr:tetratricopeptide repeat protein [Myxococcota bacterium]
MPQEGGHAAGDFGIPEAAALVGVSASRVRRLVRDGVLKPTRGPRGSLRLSFRDIALLRSLRDQGGELVVREGSRLRRARTGQYVFDFAPARAPNVVAFAPRAPAQATADASSADAWVQRGCELDASDPEGAREAYRAALAADPQHVDAHVNLGCLDHEAGRLAEAESHYRAALSAQPEHATARFDLAVVLEDLRRDRDARAEYETLLRGDPACAEAHHNLARLCERIGDRPGALRHWVAFRQLARDDA